MSSNVRGETVDKNFSKVRSTLSVAASLALGVLGSNMATAHQQGSSQQSFRTIFPLDGVSGYPAQEMIENCDGEFAHAKARLRILQRHGKTRIRITVRNAAPSTFYTVWLRLYNGSPLTGAGATPLANTSDIANLCAVTPDSALTTDAEMASECEGDDGTGSDDVVNGFFTNEKGNGHFLKHLNFPVIKGAYQFQEFDLSIDPAPIDDTPFTLRLASHCTDQVGHGLVPGVHEMWFDWP